MHGTLRRVCGGQCTESRGRAKRFRVGGEERGASWELRHSYLLQALHVFEVESDVKKAEIRIYKLKL